MNVLDKIMAVLDRRKVLALRKELANQRQQIFALKTIVDEQVSQITNANGRVSLATNANLELKRVLQECSPGPKRLAT